MPQCIWPDTILGLQISSSQIHSVFKDRNRYNYYDQHAYLRSFSNIRRSDCRPLGRQKGNDHRCNWRMCIQCGIRHGCLPWFFRYRNVYAALSGKHVDPEPVFPVLQRTGSYKGKCRVVPMLVKGECFRQFSAQ